MANGNKHWTWFARMDEVADIIEAQLHVYIAEGKGEKAIRLIGKIRRKTRQRVYS